VTKSDLTDLQHSVMKALWSIGEGSLSDVSAALTADGKTLAPTTVATLLQRMKKQGWVRTRKSGRQFMYRAQVAEQDAASGALSRVVRTFFGGNIAAVAAQLLESDQLTADELEQMRRLLEKRES
jgi:predicted transcriptional regulator